MKLIKLLTATMLAVTMAFTAYADEPKDKVTAGLYM